MRHHLYHSKIQRNILSPTIYFYDLLLLFIKRYINIILWENILKPLLRQMLNIRQAFRI